MVSFKTTPGALTNKSEPVFAIAKSEKLTNLECQIDVGGFSPCALRNKIGPLSDGSHTFEAQATDLAGNPSNLISHTFTADTTRPETTLDSGPTGTTGADVGFEFSSDEAGSFQCKLDTAPWNNCSSPKNYTGLADGKHTFRVRAVDFAGNKDRSAAKRTWTVDGTIGVTCWFGALRGWLHHQAANRVAVFLRR